MRPLRGGRGRRVAVLLPVLIAVLLVPLKASFASSLGHASLVSPHDDWAMWTAMLACACVGLRAEKTRVGAALSSPLVTMFISLILVNCGVLPTSAPAYNTVNKFLVPLAVPLLLFSADLRKVMKDTGSLLLAFFIGAFATLASTVLAAAVFPMNGVEGAWKIAAALCSRHIGGAINYVAVADVLEAPAAVVTAGIAADNLVVAVYFIAIFAMANSAGSTNDKNVVENNVEEEGSASFTIVDVSSGEELLRSRTKVLKLRGKPWRSQRESA
ncbi:hypothetical protein GUITHDRAFT_115468 [Guillardia theta CCMP2712]|uniref:Uncharacterized protein n=1 Tax=Guillardia theta (strain CCMP2712) TaxID=905079 RepID=L1IR25_GUITC|nr:hypothetical protein GUITHDRAFT_115468 [Guillardia theta CCMP2712]EKX38319.1 hypothetical protein GUITHDRAFT_115468 [Guillardia theta CCMP2712]|eukprot:XP_005825299.1 hypothetical protein GUITHDRAFT_115468 [Guillardia theta CCMP2712]